MTLTFGILVASSCSTSGETSLQKTQVALYVEQTIVARDIAKLTQMANAPTPLSTATNLNEIPSFITPSISVDTPTSVASENDLPSEFSNWIKTARILLYEGITGDSKRSRIIAFSLANLGVEYFDAGSQIGEFQTQLSSNNEWDLIIYARENRDKSSGSPFGEIFAEYDRGASIIIEHWNLDDILNYSASFSLKLEECGVVISKDWYDPNGNADLLLYAHNTNNPIHNQPNKDIRLTSFGNTRWTGDIGDIMRIKPRNQAQILYGTLETSDTTNGTVVACFSNRW